MFEYHYMQPEGIWRVFKDGEFVAVFMTPEEAQDYCNRHNQRRDWTADEILKREG